MTDRIDQLERLKCLRDQGAIDEAEYASEKARLLAGTPAGAGRPVWILLGILIAVVVGAIALFAFRPKAEGTAPDESQLLATSGPSAAAQPEITATPEPVAQWECNGWYTGVEFSELSGDGSGVEVRFVDGRLKAFRIWEGGVSDGAVSNVANDAEVVKARISFPDYPEQEAEPVTFACNDGKVRMTSRNFGNDTLRRGRAE
ncbi:SHOCT domain-containing protein [Novosphingobium sp. TH158]|uniref:SHOCT domain-containing protein n=1 Tax=Novosphingobium sp. TH158 TaxID=2067455 RepID=UPI000C7BF809|nr:SHOCT domain-containing protein [Novosphingobium sp. TH158]PLK26116.1 hypothetical protein C0V78_03880 [Novosphingobium sp. TH158]